MLVSATRANHPHSGAAHLVHRATRQMPSEQRHRQDDLGYLQIWHATGRRQETRHAIHRQRSFLPNGSRQHLPSAPRTPSISPSSRSADQDGIKVVTFGYVVSFRDNST